MTRIPSTGGADFRMLCKVLGGEDLAALGEYIAANKFQRLFDMAQRHDLLPALAVRCNEQNFDSALLGEEKARLLKIALLENTQRNMSICAQAIKISKLLNQVGITPLFLKGTARLLSTHTANIGFRKQVDIDLVVRPAEIEKAGDAFLADGYSYCQLLGDSSLAPVNLGNTSAALKLSAAHHHLPPLLKPGCAVTVELHRHFLDKRFQRANPLAPLFTHARQLESHGAVFQIPCVEQQIIHLVLGKLVNDGYLARRAFPIREACDLIDLLEEVDGENIDRDWIVERCGRRFSLFIALVSELMAYKPRITIAEPGDTTKYTRLMQKRYDSPLAGKLLDAYARAGYLTHALIYNPAKLPGYLHGLVSLNKS